MRKLDWQQKEWLDDVEGFRLTKTMAFTLRMVASARAGISPGCYEKDLPKAGLRACLAAKLLKRGGSVTFNGEVQPPRVLITQAGSLALQLARLARRKSDGDS